MSRGLTFSQSSAGGPIATRNGLKSSMENGKTTLGFGSTASGVDDQILPDRGLPSLSRNLRKIQRQLPAQASGRGNLGLLFFGGPSLLAFRLGGLGFGSAARARETLFQPHGLARKLAEVVELGATDFA